MKVPRRQGPADPKVPMGSLRHIRLRQQDQVLAVSAGRPGPLIEFDRLCCKFFSREAITLGFESIFSI